MLSQGITTELKVGLFTVAALATLGALVVVLDGNPFGQQAQHFHTILDNVGGVGERTQVRTAGVAVGEVENIEILPKGAKVNFRIASNVKIPKGSIIELRSRGILGDVFLEIVRKEDATESLAEGSLIPKVKEFNDMSSLMNSLGSIAEDIKLVTTTLSKVLGTENGKNSLQNILANIESKPASNH
jgi:phospholipid/cholesterol/gamma-HCH transport system substrate-binding protein